MDIYNFVNSKAVREYLRDIGYQFSTLEAAWLIWHCKSLSMDERHSAWNRLMQDMPDYEMPKRANCRIEGTLFEYIKKYMEVEIKMLISFFQQKDNCIFHHEASYIDEEGEHPFVFDYMCYTTIEECVDSIKELYGDEEYTEIGITKVYLNGGPEHKLWLRNDKTIISVTDECLTEEEKNIFEYGFDGMWFDFPTPFKKGDILYKPDAMRGLSDRPFVLVGQNYRDTLNEETRAFIIKDGDTTDMSVCGSFATPDGRMYNENIENYLDLEYYQSDFENKQKCLKELSKFIKGEIDIVQYSEMYRKILLGIRR